MVKAWIFLCVPSLATWKTGTVWKMTLWLCSLHRTEINTTCLPFFIKRTKVVRLWHHWGHQQLRWKSVMTATFTWTSLQWRMSQLQYLERTRKTCSVFVLWFHVGDATVDAGTWWLRQNAHHDPEAGCIQLHTLRRPRKPNVSTQHTEAATCNSAVCTSLPISPEPAASRGAKKVQLASAWLKHLSKFTNLTEFKMQCQSAFSCLFLILNLRLFHFASRLGFGDPTSCQNSSAETQSFLPAFFNAWGHKGSQGQVWKRLNLMWNGKFGSEVWRFEKDMPRSFQTEPRQCPSALPFQQHQWLHLAASKNQVSSPSYWHKLRFLPTATSVACTSAKLCKASSGENASFGRMLPSFTKSSTLKR